MSSGGVSAPADEPFRLGTPRVASRSHLGELGAQRFDQRAKILCLDGGRDEPILGGSDLLAKYLVLPGKREGLFGSRAIDGGD